MYWYRYFHILLKSNYAVVLISFLLHKITYDFIFTHFVSLALFLSIRSTFRLTHFLCVIFSIMHYYHTRLVTSVSNSKLSCLYVCVCVSVSCALHSGFVFYISIQYIGLKWKKGIFFSLSVASSSCHFTPLLFKLALFTVV